MKFEILCNFMWKGEGVSIVVKGEVKIGRTREVGRSTMHKLTKVTIEI